MLNLMVGLSIGFVLGLGVGVLLGRRPATSNARASLAVADTTPLLDSMLGIETPKPKSAPPASTQSPPTPATPASEVSRVAALHQNLLVKFQYDGDAVDRAIAIERERHPQMPEEELMQAAVDRWERDNR